MNTVFILEKDRLTVKLSGMTSMDSSGIGMVLGRYHKLSKKNGQVVIKNGI